MLIDFLVTEIDFSVSLNTNSDWRVLNTSSDFVGKRPIFHLILTQIDDFEVGVRQMQFTIDSNHLIVNLPEELPLIADSIFSTTEKVSEDTEFSTFIDLSVSFSHFCVTVSKAKQTLVARIGNAKVISNIISSSPTIGMNIVFSNTNFHIGINPKIPKFFQNSIDTQKRSFVEQLNVIKIVTVGVSLCVGD